MDETSAKPVIHMYALIYHQYTQWNDHKHNQEIHPALKWYVVNTAIMKNRGWGLHIGVARTGAVGGRISKYIDVHIVLKSI